MATICRACTGFHSECYRSSSIMYPIIAHASRSYRRRGARLMTTGSTQHFRSTPRRSSSSRYSNMTCIATNKHPHANAMNLHPAAVVVNSVNRCFIPSKPSTNPTKFAVIIMRRLTTPPVAARCRYHPFFPYYKVISTMYKH